MDEQEPEYPSARVLRVLRGPALQKLAAEGWLVILPRYGTFRSRRTPPKS